MSRFPWTLAALLVGFAVHPAAAQDLLTLDQAVTAALARNPSLKAARDSAAEASAHVSEARAGFFPRVTVTESWQRGDQPVFVFSSLLSARRFTSANFAIDALNHPDPLSFSRTSIGVEQIVFDAGGQQLAARRAALRRDVADLTADQHAADLVVFTTEAFGRALSARSAGRAARAALDSARADVARAERRRDAGLATDADVLSLVVHVADLEERAIRADGDAAIARADLNRLMGAAIESEPELAEPVLQDQPAHATSLTALLTEAGKKRADLRRAAAASHLADYDARSARGALLPQLAAQAALEVSGTRFADRGSSWIIGGELRWSFSTGGAELARIRAASHGRAAAQAQQDATRASVHVEIATALRGVDTARARQQAGRAAVEQARESQRIIRDRFDAGLAVVNDVLRASTAVLDAEARRTSALVDVMVSTARLHRAVGRTP
jgi:outer membrane protein